MENVSSCPINDVLNFNFSAYDYPKPMEQLTWREVLKIMFYMLLLVFALIGNVLVILVVYYNQSMRSTINYYLVNLAVADFLIACCCAMVHLVNQLTYPLFVLGAFMCKFNSFAQRLTRTHLKSTAAKFLVTMKEKLNLTQSTIDCLRDASLELMNEYLLFIKVTTLTCSVLTLAVIACDRFVAVIFPLRVRIIQQRPCLVIALIWLLAMTASVPFLIYREHFEIKWRNFVETQCLERWPAKLTRPPQTGNCIITFPSKQIYYTFVTVSLFFLPIVIMAATYCMIVWRLWVTEMPGERSDVALSTQSRAKRKVVKMVFIILIVFIICWMPLQVLILYTQFSHSRQANGPLPPWFDDLSFFAYFIAYANSAINPIIYGGFNANYRQGIKAILRCQTRSQFPIRTPHFENGDRMSSMEHLPSKTNLLVKKCFHHGGTMTTTLSSSCRHKDNRSSFTHDNSPVAIMELKYIENDRIK